MGFSNQISASASTGDSDSSSKRCSCYCNNSTDYLIANRQALIARGYCHQKIVNVRLAPAGFIINMFDL